MPGRNLAPIHWLAAEASLWRRVCRHMDAGLDAEQALEAARREVEEEARKLDEEDASVETESKTFLGGGLRGRRD